VSRDLVMSDLEIRSVHLNNVCNRSFLVQAPCRNSTHSELCARPYLILATD